MRILTTPKTDKSAILLAAVSLLAVSLIIIGLHHHDHNGSADHCPLCNFAYSVIIFSSVGVFLRFCTNPFVLNITIDCLPYRSRNYSRCAQRRAPPFLS
jgi:hypothetical protein